MLPVRLGRLQQLELVALEARWRSVRWQDSRSRGSPAAGCVARPGGPQQLLVLHRMPLSSLTRPAPLPLVDEGLRKISCASPASRWPSASTTSAAPRAPPAALGSLCPASASARSTAPGC